MNTNRPRRARLLGTITLVSGLVASATGLAGSPASASTDETRSIESNLDLVVLSFETEHDCAPTTLEARDPHSGDTLYGPLTLPNPCSDGDGKPEVPGDSPEPVIDEGTYDGGVLVSQELVCLGSGGAKWNLSWSNDDPSRTFAVRMGFTTGEPVWMTQTLEPATDTEPSTLTMGIEVNSKLYNVLEDAYASIDDVVVWGPEDIEFDCGDFGEPDLDDERDPSDPSDPPGGGCVGAECGGTPAVPEVPEGPELPVTPQVPEVAVVPAAPFEPEGSVAQVAGEVASVGADLAPELTTLPRTGSSTFPLLAFGLIVSVAGVILLVAGRRSETI